MLDDKARKAWPYDFGLVYSVTLGKGTLETGMHVQNKGDQSFDFHCLFHTYFRIKVPEERSTGVKIPKLTP
jgi:glucose-6-phosphate 1-epimerase